MWQNQNSILRSAVPEGKSVNHTCEHERSPAEYREEVAEKKTAERPHNRNFWLKLRLAEDFLSDIGRDGHAESLALVRLDHQQYPENQAKQIHQSVDGIADRKATKTSGKQTESEKHGQDNADHVQPAKYHDGLRGVEADVRALVDEVEDQAGDPTQNVAKQAGNFLVHL